MQDVEGAIQVDPYNLVPLGRRELLERRDHVYARAQDRHVEPRHLFIQLGDGARDGLRIADIHPQEQCLAPERADLVSRPLRASSIARVADHDDARALCGQQARGRRADAARSAGDERDLARQSEIHQMLIRRSV